MFLPVAEELTGSRTLYLKENIFRAGDKGMEDVVTALAKVQRYAHELK